MAVATKFLKTTLQFTVYHNANWEKISGKAIIVETLQEKHKENIIYFVVTIQIIASDFHL